MENEVTTTKPAATANPFAARSHDSSVNAGTVDIESSRAVAEAQGKLLIAKRFPRDPSRAYEQVVTTCKRYLFADAATYEFEKGRDEDGKPRTITGPSIRMAEELARAWGNVDFGIRELSQKDGVSEMQAYCWDMETNVVSSQNFTVKHERHTRKGSFKLTDPRDIYELTANQGGRRLRARILAIIPPDLVEAALEECEKTIKAGNGDPIEARVAKMLSAFASQGVNEEHIAKKLGHPIAEITVDELAKLGRLCNSIRDGFVKPADAFDMPKLPTPAAAAANDVIKGAIKAKTETAQPEKGGSNAAFV